MCLDEMPGITKKETFISGEIMKKMFVFGVRINVNIEGNVEYLVSLENLVRKYLKEN